MYQSKLFAKTLREPPKDEVSKNAKLLMQGGFMHKNSAGVFTYLPLGLRVMKKIMEIAREEMNAIGGQEIFMPALVEKKYMDATGRWNIDIGFEVKGKDEKNPNFTLGWTHEEIITSIAAHFIHSYKDLPLAVYQLQTKFRNEPRAKSGLLRGREFMMKDLYSFHIDEKDFLEYYAKVKLAYQKIFERCGLKSIYTLAGGGAFTQSITHEFQVIAEAGEDSILVCDRCAYAENEEISKMKENEKCAQCGEGVIQKKKTIEVGNIFPLGTKYSDAFNLVYADANGAKNSVVMGSYGIGIGRLMGTIVEIYNDEQGIIWPDAVAPFSHHIVPIISVNEEENKQIQERAESLVKKFESENKDVLVDDRYYLSAGERFADSDLIGIPNRVIVSQKTLAEKSYELMDRKTKKSKLIKF